MPRKTRIPSYSLHKPSGQARVILHGRHVYLGPYGSPKSKEAYARLIAEAVQAPVPAARELDGMSFPDLSVNEMLLRYMQYAMGYYVDPQSGGCTDEVGNVRAAVNVVRELYGTTRVSHFGPKALKACIAHMEAAGSLSRQGINARLGRIKRVFKWAVSEELIPASVYEGLRSVSGLRFGRTQAAESQPVRPVDDAAVDATAAFLPPTVAHMVALQRLTGMRPQDVTQMRLCDIDMKADVWVYEPSAHKNRFRGHRRQVPLGPRAQAILQDYLRLPPDAYLFSPKDAERWRRNQRDKGKAKRKTPMYPSEIRRVEELKSRRQTCANRRRVGNRYTTSSYRRAVSYAIALANSAGVKIPPWAPNRLRHARATEVRRDHGIEAAQVVLGHSKADVTQIYAERNMELARAVARKSG